MNVGFSVRTDGQVDVHLGPEWPVLNDALNDSISSLPPRGGSGNGPSTFWIDHAESGARTAHRTGDERPFIWGNSTRLLVLGDSVVASYDYAETNEPGEEMPMSEFFSVLKEWRRRVTEEAEKATQPLSELYRRNPPPTVS
jgi:hypothetical protein